MKRRFIFIRDYYPYDELFPTGKYRISLEGTIHIEIIEKHGPFGLIHFKRWISEDAFQLIEEIKP